MSFGERLTEARKDKGLSQEHLATPDRTKRPAVGRYEPSVAKPTIEVASKLADALGVSLDYLVGKVDTALDADTLNRVRAISALSDDDRSFVLRAMEGLIRDLKTQRAYAIN